VFYSRPKIEPLGWDLPRWPEPEGTKHFIAVTTDGRPVDFWFSGGWITVSRGPAGATVDCPEMEEVLSLKIAPFGIMDIEAEQICDMLGITVNGCSIDSAGIRTGARGFDWSGKTTYWESGHLMQSRNDAREFVQKLCDAFPGSILIQTEYGSHGRSRSRQISFLMASDEGVCLGVGPKQPALDKLLSQEQGWEDVEKVFAYGIGFLRDDGFMNDPTGARHIHKSATELGIKYDVVHHRRYRIWLSYETQDLAAQAHTNTVLSVMRANFSRGLEIVNLQTGALMAENIPDSGDRWSYSAALRDEWREKRERYLYVCRSVEGDDYGWMPGTFWGARPNERNMRPAV
jgi:hypothetical protein